MAKLEIDINKLSPEERLDLIAELWDNLSADRTKTPVTDTQAKELDRRLVEMDHDVSLGIPWETVLAHIRPTPNFVWMTFFKRPYPRSTAT
jgi:putative addiction module component (TIGR02574 family)